MMNYKELKALLQKHECSCPTKHLTAGITFASFGPDNHEVYSWESSTYLISSDNKAFQPDKGGYSIFGYCLDSTDQGIRLDWRMREEQDVESGWIVKDCFVTGCLLIECSDLSISATKLFCTRNDAVEYMLSHLAEKGRLDYEQLKLDYAATEELFEDGLYGAAHDSAWLAGQDEDWHWKIQPVRIYGPLDMVFPEIENSAHGGLENG